MSGNMTAAGWINPGKVVVVVGATVVVVDVLVVVGAAFSLSFARRVAPAITAPPTATVAMTRQATTRSENALRTMRV